MLAREYGRILEVEMKETHTRLPKLPDPDRCCGCGACRAICPKGAIAMVADAEGFLQPQVDAAQCVHCGKCESVCPVLHPGKPRQPLAVYAAKAKDDELRRGSASGGIFTVLAQETLKRGGVVFGAGFERPTWRVIHKGVTTGEELDDLRGSKYVQSDTGDTFKEAKAYLEAGREVLYSGCPCQIAALKRFLGRDYPNLITVDLICHGVPSPLAWRKYLDCREAEAGAKITKILARRYCAWEDFAISIGFEGSDEITYSKTVLDDSYVYSFMYFWGLRRTCLKCVFRKLRSGSNLTIGDYGNIDETHPEMNDHQGVSVVLIDDATAEEVWCRVMSRVESCIMSFANICKINTAIYKSHSSPARFRDHFYRRIVEGGFDVTVSAFRERRQVPFVQHVLWWLKRLLVNRECNRFQWS